MNWKDRFIAVFVNTRDGKPSDHHKRIMAFIEQEMKRNEDVKVEILDKNEKIS